MPAPIYNPLLIGKTDPASQMVMRLHLNIFPFELKLPGPLLPHLIPGCIPLPLPLAHLRLPINNMHHSRIRHNNISEHLYLLIQSLLRVSEPINLLIEHVNLLLCPPLVNLKLPNFGLKRLVPGLVL